MEQQRPKTITVGDLRAQLAGYSDNTPLYFGHGDLSFVRVKNRGGSKDMLNIEFGELYDITYDPDLPG